MITKNQLKGHREIVRNIQRLETALARLHERVEAAKRPEFHDVDVQQSPEKYDLSDDIAKIEDMESRIAAKRTKIKAFRGKVLKEISQMRDVEKTIIKLYYLDGYTWPEVSSKINFSEIYVYKLHGRILQRLQQKKRV